MKIKKYIFQGDVLPSQLFLFEIIPLNHILRRYIGGYKLDTSQEKINPLTYMDDVKLFTKTEKELETLMIFT